MITLAALLAEVGFEGIKDQVILDILVCPRVCLDVPLSHVRPTLLPKNLILWEYAVNRPRDLGVRTP